MVFNPFRRRRRHHRCHGEHHNGSCSLGECEAGDRVVVACIDTQVSCAPRLRELGIMEGMPLLVLRKSDPLLVLTEESRIAIDQRTADCIEVRIIVPAE